MNRIKSAAPRCQCPEQGKLSLGWAWSYDWKLELPFVTHAPGKCKCTNELKRYRRGKKILWLCSCCRLPGDVLILTK